MHIDVYNIFFISSSLDGHLGGCHILGIVNGDTMNIGVHVSFCIFFFFPEKSVCRSRSNRTGHGTTDLFQIGNEVHQGCILSPCLFNLYPEYIMGNAGLEEAQAEIKIAGRNVNNLRYADETNLMTESREELKQRAY